MEEKTMPVEEISAEESPISSNVQKVAVSCYKCGAELKVKIRMDCVASTGKKCRNPAWPPIRS